MDVIILAGGQGTRLSSISNGVPKSLMPVGSKVFLDILIQNLINNGIDRIFISLCYKPNIFKNYISSKKNIFDIEIFPVVEPYPLGTGGAVNYIINKKNLSDPFFVVNGDSISKLDFKSMAKEFNTSCFDSMIAISKVHNTSRYGKIKFKGNKVISFEEKTQSSTGWINNGSYIFKKKAFLDFKMKSNFSIESDLFLLSDKKNNIGIFKSKNDQFIDIGIPEDYNKFLNIFKRNNHE